MIGDFVFGFIQLMIGLALLCSIIIIAPFIYVIGWYSEKTEEEAIKESYDND
jgi:hypothetical protein